MFVEVLNSRRFHGAPHRATTPCWCREDISSRVVQDVISGFEVRSAGAPRTVPSATIPTEEVPNSSKRVVLYRDTNGWCPFCQRVWMVRRAVHLSIGAALLAWLVVLSVKLQLPVTSVRSDHGYMILPHEISPYEISPRIYVVSAPPWFPSCESPECSG